MRRALVPLVLAGLLAVSAANATQLQTRALRFKALLDLHATDLQGRTWTHDRLRGHITLVDFWATWCAPCLREMPFLQRARTRYGDRFEILGVSLDTMSRPSLRSWLARQNIRWPQVRAAGGYEDELALAFAIDRLPTNLLLDRHGRLRTMDVRGAQLFTEIDRLLAEESR